MNLAFQLFVMVDSQAEPEILHVGRTKTIGNPEEDIDVFEYRRGFWEFVFVARSTLGSTEPVLRLLEHYGLAPMTVVAACAGVATASRARGFCHREN